MYLLDAMASRLSQAATQRFCVKPVIVVCTLLFGHLAPMAHAVEQPYVDRLIPAGELPAESDDTVELYDSSGSPRSVQVETGFGWQQFNGLSNTEQSLGIGGWYETPNWGRWSLNANAWHGAGSTADSVTGSGATLTLWQRGLYMPGGWRGDNGLGVLSTPQLPLMREQSRLFLPTTQIVGASTDWQSKKNSLRWQAAYGVPGYYTGGRVSGFEPGEGNVATTGLEWAPGKDWRVAADWLGSNIPVPAGTSTGNNYFSFQPGQTNALYSGARWQGANDSVQVNLLGSENDGMQATGVWLDARDQRGRWRHDYGLYHLGNGLSYGPMPMSNNAEGVYYRANYQYARWQWSGSVDTLRQLESKGFSGLYASTYTRYQINNRLGLGGSLSLRKGRGDDANSMSVFVDHKNSFGLTRWQLDHASDQSGRRDWRLGVDQTLPTDSGSNLSVSLAYEDDHDPAAGIDGRGITAAINGSLDLSDRMGVSGSLRYSRALGTGLNANLSFNWRLNSYWTAIASIYQNQWSQQQDLIIDPLAPPVIQNISSRDRSIFLSLRYQFNAGRPQAVLAGSAGGPAGDISGSVFLDRNGNGLQEADELPANAVTVVLDGSYSVQTDRQGRYSFPHVAIGPHTMTVMPDNLPLPWRFANGTDHRSVDVTVRHDSTVNFPAIRDQ